MRNLILLLLCTTSYSLMGQYTNLNFLDLATNSPINNRSIHPDGPSTFNASISNSGTSLQPYINQNGVIGYRLSAGSVQCLNLSFSEIVDVRISNVNNPNGGITEYADSFYIDKINYTENDPENRMGLVVMGGILGIKPIDNVNEYSDWDLTFHDYSSITICALQNSISGSSNVRSQLRIQVVNATLPVELGFFKGSYFVNGEVKLNWQILAEDNLHYFEIERSINGVEWMRIDEIEVHEAGEHREEYSFVDNSIVNDQVYYRLKLVNKNGEHGYSPVIRIQENDRKSQVLIYPNPVSNELQVRGSTAIQEDIEIYNISGQRMNVGKRSSVPDGVKYDVSQLPVGQYVIRSSSFVQLFVKL